MDSVVLWFIIGLILGLIVGYVFSWSVFKRRITEKEDRLRALQKSLAEKEREVGSLGEQLQAQKTAAAAPPPPAPDDLKVIEGIGPKISELLQGAGISTFAELARANVSRLEEILKEARLEMTDPRTWPDQATLAAVGRWDALQVLQDELKGGRQV
jgi:predicted flap endonuclease-1-like 5' DNA nuclease